jgi:hypothetical protein
MLSKRTIRSKFTESQSNSKSASYFFIIIQIMMQNFNNGSAKMVAKTALLGQKNKPIRIKPHSATGIRIYY